jgi:protein-S-isoprenylcysteine O-methyltransferase Ste14
VLVFFALREFRNCGTSEDTNVPTTAIVTRGPYRFSRNPMYVSLTLMLVGVGVAANIWWILLMVAPVLVVMHVGVIVREERYLAQKFGQVYQDYKASVRRWF